MLMAGSIGGRRRWRLQPVGRPCRHLGVEEPFRSWTASVVAQQASPTAPAMPPAEDGTVGVSAQQAPQEPMGPAPPHTLPHGARPALRRPHISADAPCSKQPVQHADLLGVVTGTIPVPSLAVPGDRRALLDRSFFVVPPPRCSRAKS